MMRYNLWGYRARILLKKTVVLFLILACMAIIVPALGGCGGAVKPTSASSNPTAPASSPAEPATAPETKNLSKQIVGASGMTPEEISAAQEALRCAKDSNTGSSFKALDVKCVKGWARVSVEETGVPADEAVGFGVYLKTGEDGKWDVVQTGTGLTSDDIPVAPAELFAE
jgi:hypothetical protein